MDVPTSVSELPGRGSGPRILLTSVGLGGGSLNHATSATNKPVYIQQDENVIKKQEIYFMLNQNSYFSGRSGVFFKSLLLSMWSDYNNLFL